MGRRFSKCTNRHTFAITLTRTNQTKKHNATAQAATANLVKLLNTHNFEKMEKARWRLNQDASTCTSCDKNFSIIVRRHHCRACGDIFCDDCTKWKVPLPHKGYSDRVRSCCACASPQIVQVSSVPTVGGEMLISAHNVGTSVDGLVVTVDGVQ